MKIVLKDVPEGKIETARTILEHHGCEGIFLDGCPCDTCPFDFFDCIKLEECDTKIKADKNKIVIKC